MSTTSMRRGARYTIAAVALLAALVVTASAAATTSTFRFFEVNAQANYRVVDQCADGTTRTALVTVIAGHEEEQVDGETTTDEDFLTVILRGATCDQDFGPFRRILGTGEFTWSPSLQTASVTGTVSGGGFTVDVNMSWDGTGPLEVTQNTTTRPGFVGHFTGTEREATATGTVVVNGETVVDGTTTSAHIETLEDNNRFTPNETEFE